MPDFGDLANKAKDLAGQHQDQVDKGAEKAEELADKKLGGQHQDQVKQAGDRVEGFLGDNDQK
jgi:hypothetical protein